MKKGYRRCNDHYSNRFARYHAKQRLASGKTLIRCEVCGEAMLLVNHNHLKKHGLTQDDYKRMFPHAPTCSRDVISERTETKCKNLYEPITLTARVRSLLLGSMLGDGTLECTKTNARYKEHGRNREYFAWKASILQENFPVRFTSCYYTDARNGHLCFHCRATTRAHPVLTEWYHRWYCDGKKRLCRTDVERYLDPLALAVWFYDDGHVSKQPRDYRAYLYTMCFAPEDVEWLAGLLVRRFGTECRAVALKVNGSYKPSIVFPRQGRDALIDIIKQYPAPGMLYKLDAPQPKFHRRLNSI